MKINRVQGDDRSIRQIYSVASCHFLGATRRCGLEQARTSGSHALPNRPFDENDRSAFRRDVRKNARAQLCRSGAMPLSRRKRARALFEKGHVCATRWKSLVCHSCRPVSRTLRNILIARPGVCTSNRTTTHETAARKRETASGGIARFVQKTRAEDCAAFLIPLSSRRCASSSSTIGGITAQ